MDKDTAREQLLALLRPAEFTHPDEAARREFGFHPSTKKGTGFDFIQHDPYQEGEDERFVDWNVFARTGEKFVKRFLREESIPVFPILDLTPSMFTGSRQFLGSCTWKCEAAFFIAAAIHGFVKKHDDPVGTAFIDPRGGLHFFLPIKGEGSFEGLFAAWDVIWEHQLFPQTKTPQSFVAGLEKTGYEIEQAALPVICSDLQETFLPRGLDTFERTLENLLGATESAIIAVVRTPIEYEPPEKKADMAFRGGKRLFKIRFTSRRDRARYQKITEENRVNLKKIADAHGVPIAFLTTNNNIISDFETQLLG